jgi:hypothetical protein
MPWSLWIHLFGLIFLLTGILLLIWSLFRKYVSSLGLALVILGFLLELLAAFME